LFIFLAFSFFIFSINFSSALSVSPAKIELNFEPDYNNVFDYTIKNTLSEKTYSLYVSGDLSEYLILDKKEISSPGGTFKATLNLPASIDKPGKHTIIVGVKEEVDEEVLGTTIGTAIAIQVIINVYVPYPGKYLETYIKSENVNKGESVDFELGIINRGKQEVSFTPKIDIFPEQSNESIETLFLNQRVLPINQELNLHKLLDTSSYNPGKYKAVSVIDYGVLAKDETFFKIGDLFINVLNHTKKVFIQDKSSKFEIEIESGWNDKIDGVHGEVFFMNNSNKIVSSIETSSTSLNSWESKTITGFFEDTLNFTEGVYDANITLIYYGKETGKTSSEVVQVEFIKKSGNYLIALIILGIVSLIIILFFVLKKFFLKKK